MNPGKNVNVVMLPPESINIISDATHKLYDPRIELPLSGAMVDSIKEHGIQLPILAMKDADGKVTVVDGLQRVRNCLKANEILAKEGSPSQNVPVRIIDESDVTKLFAAKCITNSIRTNDLPTTKAQNMKRLMEMEGQTPDTVALAFGTTKSDVAQHLTLLDLAPQVKKIVDQGVLGVSGAYKLKDMPAEEVNAVISHAKDLTQELKRNDGKVSVRALKEAVKEAKGKGPTAPSKGKIIAFKKGAKEFLTEEMDAVLAWVTTGKKTGPFREVYSQYEAKMKEEAEEEERIKLLEKEEARVERENARAAEKEKKAAEKAAAKKAEKEALEAKLKAESEG